MLIYHFDPAGALTNQEYIDDGTPIPNDATVVPPINPDGTAIIRPVWSNGSWSGNSQSELYNQAQSTPEQQAITALAQQMANLTETNTQLEQAITALATEGDK